MKAVSQTGGDAAKQIQKQDGACMITYHDGNLFDSHADALAHGCNTIGKMDGGIARHFKERYPDMFADYKKRCEEGKFLPGTGYIYTRQEKPHIINLATQHYLRANAVYVDSALRWLSDTASKIGLAHIAMPRIATGLGGLEWETVQHILKHHFSESPLEIQVWTQPH
ncbi:macro domain-containing protein [Candidatus Woesearchaeota archaeon]|nr:macro domain-containing protein [Candidatus Woesearchaeota archaeon]